MDISPIISQMTNALWYLIPIVISIGVLKSSWFKGVVGEFLVNLSVRLFLDKEKYRLVKNVTLPTEDGSTQIDHIIISEFGIFVIETKNMKGWIFGNPNNRTWTQKIYKHSSKFQNPLHQNYKHVKALSSLLGLNDQQVFSVIVFVGDSTFKTKMPENVTQGGSYIRYVKSKKTPVLTKPRVMEIIDKIETGRIAPSFKTNRNHVKHVKTIVAEMEKKSAMSCPKCGSSMVLREAKKGQNIGKKFWGCSKFPKCRGFTNIPIES